MLDLTLLAKHLLASGPNRVCGVWPLFVVALAAMLGCRTAPYRAASLPDELRVATTNNSNDLNLSNLSGLSADSSHVGPGDLVELTITSGGEKEKVEPTLARVAEDGSVTLPLIGAVSVAGVEPFEAGQRIAAAAVQQDIYRQPAVVVQIKEPAFNRVTVMGAVAEPGVQKLRRSSSDVLGAIAAAGGFTKEAGTEVEILRQRSPSILSSTSEAQGVVTASYSEPFIAPPLGHPNSSAHVGANLQTVRLDLAQANPSRRADYGVGDGDIVMVLPEVDRLIHVSGLVNTPNQFKIPKDQDVYLLDAIAMAGGVKSVVADKVLIIRRLEGAAEPAVIQASIAKAKKDSKENLRLTAGDLISVESTVLTNTVDTLAMFFRMSVGIGGNLLTF